MGRHSGEMVTISTLPMPDIMDGPHTYRHINGMWYHCEHCNTSRDIDPYHEKAEADCAN